MKDLRASPSREDVREQIARLMSEIAGIPIDCATDAATLDGTLQMQSVQFVELQVAIEDEYQIEIDPIRVVELNGLGAIVEYIHDCIRQAAR